MDCATKFTAVDVAPEVPPFVSADDGALIAKTTTL
jgi:hypothetical protein